MGSPRTNLAQNITFTGFRTSRKPSDNSCLSRTASMMSNYDQFSLPTINPVISSLDPPVKPASTDLFTRHKKKLASKSFNTADKMSYTSSNLSRNSSDISIGSFQSGVSKVSGSKPMKKVSVKRSQTVKVGSSNKSQTWDGRLFTEDERKDLFKDLEKPLGTLKKPGLRPSQDSTKKSGTGPNQNPIRHNSAASTATTSTKNRINKPKTTIEDLEKQLHEIFNEDDETSSQITTSSIEPIRLNSSDGKISWSHDYVICKFRQFILVCSVMLCYSTFDFCM